jgi:xanthine dehydrogenase YagS FAD-binding subunit
VIRFDYARAGDVADAVRQGSGAATRFLAGGTNLVDLMKENVERPARVVDINRLPLGAIEELDGGGLRLGALATNHQTAYDARVQSRYPLLASAILAGASPQLRNAATNGGNLNQRTRCYYFYDTATACNKREPGSGCGAIGGVNRIHAILGASEHCIATHPSDMCVALAALAAQVRISGLGGERVVPFADYHRLPGDEPWRDNTLAAGELVTAIDLPAEEFSANYTYLKLRDRLSYAFALVSVAVAMRLDASGTIGAVRIALGGVAHKPWRLPEAEAALLGQVPSPALFRDAAERLTSGAVGQGANDFKIELARRAVMRALKQAADGTPQSQTDKRVA